MIDYNIIKFCRLCKERFVVRKAQAKMTCCPGCQPKISEQWRKNERNSKIFQ